MAQDESMVFRDMMVNSVGAEPSFYLRLVWQQQRECRVRERYTEVAQEHRSAVPTDSDMYPPHTYSIL